jgi:hypothetical protein
MFGIEFCSSTVTALLHWFGEFLNAEAEFRGSWEMCLRPRPEASAKNADFCNGLPGRVRAENLLGCVDNYPALIAIFLARRSTPP